MDDEAQGTQLAAPEPASGAGDGCRLVGEPPLVSLVYVAYKQEKFATESICSALAQTYRPLEIIAVDDASPDATADIIAAEVAKHPRRGDVQLIRNPSNLGAFATMRKALSLTRGDFIVGLAGDDVMLPTMVERMAEIWQARNVSLVTANVAYIDEDGNELNRFFMDPNADCDDSFETLARDGFNAVCFGCAMGFERNLYLEFGYPPEYLTTEDIMLPFYAYLRKGACFVNEPLLKYRVHPGNSSLSLRQERAGAVGKLFLQAETFYARLAHALLMLEELERQKGCSDAVANSAPVIQPLLVEQTIAMARGLVDARIRLNHLGINRLIDSPREY